MNYQQLGIKITQKYGKISNLTGVSAYKEFPHICDDLTNHSLTLGEFSLFVKDLGLSEVEANGLLL